MMDDGMMDDGMMDDGCKPAEVELRLVNPHLVPGTLVAESCSNPQAQTLKRLPEQRAGNLLNPAGAPPAPGLGRLRHCPQHTLLHRAPDRMQLDRGLNKPPPPFPDSRLESDRLLLFCVVDSASCAPSRGS